MTVQELLGTELPIIQAPMAGVQGSALAVAVSNAGGLGSLPCAMLEPGAMRRELFAIHSQCAKPYNVNFFCHPQPAADRGREAAWQAALAPYYADFGIDANSIVPGPARLPFSAEAADVLQEFRPPVVSFHFGLPSTELLDRVKGWGARVLSSATTVEEALWLEEQGVDAIIAQGVEAGGHRGMFLTTDISTQVGTSRCFLRWCAPCRFPSSPPAALPMPVASRPPWRWARRACRWARPTCCATRSPRAACTARR